MVYRLLSAAVRQGRKAGALTSTRCQRTVSAQDQEFLCTRKCGGQLVAAAPPTAERTAPLADLDPDHLPSVVAVPLLEYLNEKDPVLTLWHTCDTVALPLRLVVFMGLADLRRGGDLAPGLLAEL